MDSLKVQLGTKQQLLDVEKKLIEEAVAYTRKLTDLTREELAAVKDAVTNEIKEAIKLASENVQVNGYDWKQVDEHGARIEAYRPELFQRMQDLKAQVNEDVVEAVQLRRSVPQELAKAVGETKEALEQALQQDEEEQKAAGGRQEDAGDGDETQTVAPASLKRSLEQTLRGIDELKKSMPLLADKLKRAIIVLTDMPAMAAGEAEVMAATSAADAGEQAATASPAKKRRGAK